METTKLLNELISDNEIKEGTIDFMADVFSTLSGDKIAMAKIMLTLAKSPMYFRQKLFWTKWELFLNGVYASDDDRAQFCAKLSLCDGYKDNAYRLIQIIDRVESLQKIKYLINAGKCLASDFIDLSLFFRICNIIVNSLDEDLIFLKENIMDDLEYEYGYIVQGLINTGLMYQSLIDKDGSDKYKFTPIADIVDRYALSYDNVNRYPMCGNEKVKLKDKKTNANLVAKFG